MLMLKNDPSAEEILLLQLLRNSVGEKTGDFPPEIKHSQINWDEFLQESLNQGMFPEFYRTLFKENTVRWPPEFQARVEETYLSLVRKNTNITAEAIRLWHAFDSANLPAVPYKGFALANMLYGNEFSRQYDDIDILISNSRLEPFSNLLMDLGYIPDKNFSGKKKLKFIKWECELGFVHKTNKTMVELHWAVAPVHLGFSTDFEYLNNKNAFEFKTGQFPQLTPEAMFLLLLIHNGLKHHFDRLSNMMDLLFLWKHHIADKQKLVDNIKSEKLMNLFWEFYSLATENLSVSVPFFDVNSPGKESAQGLFLTQIKKKSHTPHTNILKKIKRGERSLWLCLWQMKMLMDFRKRLNYLFKLILTPNEYDWNWVNLMDRYYFMYFGLRPLRLVYFWILK